MERRAVVFRIAFVEPRIPPNTGNAIRLAAATGCELHLIGPLAFELTDARLRRAGLDYHDLANVTVHPNMSEAWSALLPARIFAFTGRASISYADVEYRPGDVLMFGTEATGLPDEVLDDPRITEQVRLPMLPGLRSLNLSNAASIAVYEAWRQQGFAGSADVAGIFT
ncbi:MAG TPA: tRNA (cytidine(34)-2'-O)-methyltransferase [Acidothermaceae bacterium]|nr:tRNA (cytidine(34)-2'-O)-methyltransferase [Acidothermaceae bacterium]